MAYVNNQAGLNPIILDAYGVDRAWLGTYPKQEFDRRNSQRDNKNERANKTYKVQVGEDCAEAGHMRVEEPFKWKERLMARHLKTWAGQVRGLMFPARTRWLEVTSDYADPNQNMIAQGLSVMLWDKLMTGGNNFTDLGERIIEESGASFGYLVTVASDYVVDPFTGQPKLMPMFKCYHYKDFVLQAGVDDWRKGSVIVRYMVSKNHLLSLSKPLQDQNGVVVRGPVFDAAAVQQVLDQQTDYGQGSGSVLDTTIDKSATLPSAEDQVYTIYEFIGQPLHPEKQLPANMQILSCNGVCLRAANHAYRFRNWTLFGSRYGNAGDIYPESIGEELADIEIKINYAKTASAFARHVKSSGVLKYDPSREDELRKYSRHLTLRPGGILPDIGLEMLNYNPDFSDIEIERNQLLQLADEIIGVSKASLAGAPTPGVSATQSVQTAQGAQARNGNDANHYSGAFMDLLKNTLNVLINDMTMPEVVPLPNGGIMEISRDSVGQFVGSININSIGISSIAVHQQQQMMQLFQIAAKTQFFNQYEGLKMLIDSFQMPEIRTRQLLIDPQVLAMAQQGGMAPPPAGNVPNPMRPPANQLPPSGGMQGPPMSPGAAAGLSRAGMNPATARGQAAAGPVAV